MLIAQRPTLNEEQVGDFRSRFVIEPLEPGFGYTIGNSVRRTLLSSIPGAAVTSIRIEGVLHEFSTVPGVQEDVTDVILNLKALVVSSEQDEPVVMYLRKQGPGVVTAADIAPPAGVEVHNPELHIATLNAKGKLEMELTVERGRGYVSAAQNKQPGQEIGRIPIDSIYSPVLRVTYKVEATRVEQRTDFDKLILDVETKPSMRPRDAVASAGKTLVELFGLARELNVEAEGIDIGPSLRGARPLERRPFRLAGRPQLRQARPGRRRRPHPGGASRVTPSDRSRQPTTTRTSRPAPDAAALAEEYGAARSEQWFESDPLWFKSATFYEIHVRGFFDANADGSGDFRGLTEKLDYLEWLGIDCIWLLPMYPSPLRDNGYDIAEFDAVHPDFGTIDDVRTFIDSAHQRGMRVIADLVMNHTSSDHGWFQEAR